MYRRLLLSILLILLSVPIVSAAPLDIPAGRLAVTIKPPRLPDNLEYNPANFVACLENHLDYLLWMKGWDFSLVPYTQEPPNGFRYFLTLTPQIKLKYPPKNSRKRTPYPEISAQIELKADIVDLDSSLYLIRELKKKTAPLPDWVATDDSLLLVSLRQHIEPPDFVLKRLLSDLLDFLPQFPPAPDNYSSRLPVRLIIDSRIANDIKTGMEKDLLRALDYASRSLWRQFGIGLESVQVDYFSIKEIPYDDIERLFRSFIRSGLPPSDTLTLAVFRPDNAADYYIGNGTIQAGLSDLGRKTSMIAEITPPHPDCREWKIFLDGQLLLHEIGHLLGAIHVSDINSIMTARPAWLSSDRFDRLNAAIIRKGLADKSSLDKITAYLTLVLGNIDETSYPQADLPSIFFSYFNLNHKDLMRNRIAETSLGQAAISASDGYRAYMMRDSLGARYYFSNALAENSNQAAFHYYLGQVTTGALAEFHLNQAASLGYYSALHELALKRK